MAENKAIPEYELSFLVNLKLNLLALINGAKFCLLIIPTSVIKKIIDSAIATAVKAPSIRSFQIKRIVIMAPKI